MKIIKKSFTNLTGQKNIQPIGTRINYAVCERSRTRKNEQWSMKINTFKNNRSHGNV